MFDEITRVLDFFADDWGALGANRVEFDWGWIGFSSNGDIEEIGVSDDTMKELKKHPEIKDRVFVLRDFRAEDVRGRGFTESYIDDLDGILSMISIPVKAVTFTSWDWNQGS